MPFLALRSYLPADHPDKAFEMGSEADPGTFIDALLDIVEECRRVLAPHGSICFELGDSYCADTDTEILTADGWRTWTDVVAGDVVLTLNPQTRLAEWQPATAVNIFPARPRRMLSIEGRSMSALVTDDHRWLVNQRMGGSAHRSNEWEFRTTDRLTLDSSVPTAAPLANLPTEPKFSDALVEAVAWYWTEGHDRQPGIGRTQQTGIYIAQSHRVNPINVGRIRACLTALYGPSADRLPGVKGAPPAWREDVWRSNPDKTEFRLNASAARVLREHAPSRVPCTSWLASLTQAQLDLFVERSIDADGQRTSRGVGLAQASYDRASAFQTACLLAGRSASLNLRQSTCPMWTVTINTGQRRKPLRQASVGWVEHDGIVWCPTTPNGTWLARRRGTVYFTGNSGSGGAGGDYNADGLRAGQPKFRQGTPRWDGRPEGQVRTTTSDPVSYPARGRDGWPEAKSLCLIPESFRWALAYGRNPFTGRTTPRWRVRNVVRWCRPNPPVGALGDKVRPATSDMVIACTARDRYFDLDAVRTPHTEPGAVKSHSTKHQNPHQGWASNNATITQNPAGAPPLDHWWHDEDSFDQDAWLIPTAPYQGAHYATFPKALLTRPILAMCPPFVCTTCGEPSRRIAETTNAIGEAVGRRSWRESTEGIGAGHVGDITRSVSSAPSASRRTLGWSDCGHGDNYRNGVVLDPFGGSGTTAVVATGHGRDCVLVDLDERNADLARDRVGMFLTVEHADVSCPQGDRAKVAVDEGRA